MLSFTTMEKEKSAQKNRGALVAIKLFTWVVLLTNEGCGDMGFRGQGQNDRS